MRKYTVVDYFGYDLTPRERMRVIREVGFDGVILLWCDYFDEDYRDFPEYAAREGLFVENAHAPYRHASLLELPGELGDAHERELLACLEDCAKYAIPTLVVHPTNGTTPLGNPRVLLERFERLLEAAEKLGVNLAVENQGNPAHVDVILARFASERLKFCYDSGHERFYSPERDLLADHGSRLGALHLHDNSGAEDAHMLPYTGAVDWSRVARRLEGYNGALGLEAQNRGFEALEPVEFLCAALERLKQLGTG